MKGHCGYQGVESFPNDFNPEYQIVLTLNNQFWELQEKR